MTSPGVESSGVDSSPGDPFGIVGTLQCDVFRVERAVAEGGFGVVYRALHDVFRAPVALKCLKVPESLESDKRDAFLEKFRAEAELLFRLSAALPEIVRPLQFGVLEARGFVPYLALEWLEGETLHHFVRRRNREGKPPLGLGDAVTLMSPVAKALARAHFFPDVTGQNTVAIIHRDMKPENVFLAEQGGERSAKILDYGIARVKADADAMAGSQTRGDAVNAFSPAYAAPEQWYPQNYGATGPWTDVYGLALTLCEVLIGMPPISGDLTAMMGSALNPNWRPTPRTRGATISDAAEAAFAKALAVDPKARTQTIDAFWTQLELSLNRRGSITSRRQSMSFEEDAPSKLPSLAPPPALELPGGIASAPKPSQPRVPLPPLSTDRFDSGMQNSSQLGFEEESTAARLRLDVERGVSRPRPRQQNAAPSIGMFVAPAPPVRGVGERLRAGLWWVVLGVAVAVADFMLAADGSRITLGPVRLSWIGGGLITVGILVMIAQAFDD